MDWEKISEKYPKAHSQLEEYSQGADGVCRLFHWRDLYDFFDEHEIYIDITPDRPIDIDGHICGDNYFWILLNWYYEDDIRYGSRTEAEQAAFTKAFELLEEKL